MKTARFLLVFMLLFSILITSVSYMTVFAATEWSASLAIEQVSDIADDGTFTVRISVSDISADKGIICSIYHVNFDNAVLELLSWDNSYPDNWDFSGNSLFGAEDWTALQTNDDGEAYLMYTLMNTTLEDGVTDDGVLYTDIVFRALSDSVDATVINVTDISFLSHDLEDGFELSSQAFEVSLKTMQEESSDQISLDEQSSSESVSLSGDESVISEESNRVDEGDSVSFESDHTFVEDSSDQKRVVMTVLVEDILDEYGISALQFKLSYKPSFLQFVSYECILPDNWSLASQYTEDISQVDTNGDLMFCVMNYSVGQGVKTDSVLGFRIEFIVKNVEFDPSLITMSEIMLVNENLDDVDEKAYKLNISYKTEDGIINDSSSSIQDEGKTIKIVITVIVCAVILAIAATAFATVRKKRNA